MAEHIYTFINPTSERDLAKAQRYLEDDAVIAFPTDVNWALGCLATNQKAVSQIRRLKPHHPKEQPFSFLCNSFTMMSEVANFGQPAYRVLKKILPGPYTVLLKRHKRLPKIIKDKRELVGVRIPDSPLVLDLVAHLGQPIVTTSLPIPENRQDPLRFGYEVDECFGHGVELVLDLGEEIVPQETSIIDLSNEGDVSLIRAGIGDVSWI